jgi:hypothetical protein
MNVDFSTDGSLHGRLEEIQKSWVRSPRSLELAEQIAASVRNATHLPTFKASKRNFPIILMILVHRSFIKSYRDVVAYGIRIAMYAGLAIMMGTVWLRLKTDQDDIQPFINAIVGFLFSVVLDPVLTRTLVLWIGIYVLHGRCICAQFLRGPSNVRQRARKRSLWPYCIRHFEFPHRDTLSLLVEPTFNMPYEMVCLNNLPVL